MRPDVGAQEPDATADAYYYVETVDNDSYDTGGAYYYVETADDQE